MKTSLNEIKEAEGYLTGTIAAGDRLVYSARLINSIEARVNLSSLAKVFQLLRLHRRDQISSQLNKIHREFFSDPAKRSFRNSILQHFKP